MIATERPFTYADLREIPDDGLRREVIGGELIVNPAPTPGHQRVLKALFRIIDGFATETGGGEALFAPIDVLLGRFNVVQPDLVYFSAARPRIASDQQAIEEAPDLVVEVLSPSSRGIDRVRKLVLYAGAGVREYWLADPEQRSLTILILDGDEYVASQPDDDGLLDSHELCGLRIDPRDVFASLDGEGEQRGNSS